MTVEIGIRFNMEKELKKDLLEKYLKDISDKGDKKIFFEGNSFELNSDTVDKMWDKDEMIVQVNNVGFYYDKNKKHIELNFPLWSSLISGKNQKFVQNIIDYILLIGKTILIRNIVCYEISGDSYDKHEGWVWFFPDLQKEDFKDWNKGEVVELDNGVLVFETKDKISFENHDEFLEYLKEKGIK